MPRLVFGLKAEFRAQNGDDKVVNVLLPFRACRLVNIVKRVLLKVYSVKEFALQVYDKVIYARPFLADNLHHLLDFHAAGKYPPAVVYLFIFDDAAVLGPRIERVYRRILAGVAPLTGKPVERADNLQRGLRYRLLEVAAGGRYRAAYRDRTLSPVPQPDDSRPLVEARYRRFEVGGERFLAGNLFKAARHLAQGLRPAARRVGQQQHVKPHLPVVLGQRYRRVQRRLARRDRHGRCVADDYRPLHQRFSRFRVYQLGEFF